MAISYLTENVKLPKGFKKRQTGRWLNEVILNCGKKLGTIVYIFCNDEKILELNRQYLRHNYYTDIITFDYSESNKLSGDIFISLDTVKSNADIYKTNYEEELRRVIIHGVLHLCGYEDNTREKKQIMRCKEDEALTIYPLKNIETSIYSP